MSPEFFLDNVEKGISGAGTNVQKAEGEQGQYLSACYE